MTFDWNDPDRKSVKPGAGANEVYDEKTKSQTDAKPTEIRMMKDGPYVVEGDFTIFDSEGNELKKMAITSFCRCGQSNSMPFCDGTHRKISFSDQCD